MRLSRVDSPPSPPPPLPPSQLGVSYSIDLVKIVKKFAGSLKLYFAHYREAATFVQFGSDPFLQKPSYSMFASLAKPDDDTELHWVKVRCLFLPRAPLFFLSFLPCPPYSHHRSSASEASPLQYLAPFSGCAMGEWPQWQAR